MQCIGTEYMFKIVEYKVGNILPQIDNKKLDEISSKAYNKLTIDLMGKLQLTW